jgi:hypothetical protein
MVFQQRILKTLCIQYFLMYGVVSTSDFTHLWCCGLSVHKVQCLSWTCLKILKKQITMTTHYSYMASYSQTNMPSLKGYIYFAELGFIEMCKNKTYRWLSITRTSISRSSRSLEVKSPSRFFPYITKQIYSPSLELSISRSDFGSPEINVTVFHSWSLEVIIHTFTWVADYLLVDLPGTVEYIIV